MSNYQSRSDRTAAHFDNTAACARLVAIEEHLDEIVRRLNEMKTLLTMLEHVQSNDQHTVGN